MLGASPGHHHGHGLPTGHTSHSTKPRPPGDPSIEGATTGPIQLRAKYLAAGGLFHTGHVLLWGESRRAEVRDFRKFLGFPVVEQPVNWTLVEAGAGPQGSPALREVASGQYAGTQEDRRCNIWCAGNAFLGDGRLLVAGADGDYKDSPQRIDRRLTAARLVDPAQPGSGFRAAANMNLPRWYPGLVTLGDGRALASFGLGNRLELYDPVADRWTLGASTEPIDPRGLFDDYPWTPLLPDGRVLLLGAWGPRTFLYDPAKDRVEEGARQGPGSEGKESRRHGGSAVLLGPAQEGRVLLLGGGEHFHAAARSVEAYDSAQDRWEPRAPMLHPRHHFGQALLPTGQVWVSGGGGGRFHLEEVARKTELYDPARDAWTPTADLREPRGYHHVSLLLPDGSVLVAGERASAEVYYPPYFFGGRRPEILEAPRRLRHGEAFALRVREAAGDRVHGVVLLRQGAMTHSYNFDQRLVPLEARREGDSIEGRAPADGNVAPPGFYLLFALSEAGLPTAGAWVRFGP